MSAPHVKPLTKGNKTKWSIIYERITCRITYDSAEDCEVEDVGYLRDGLTFREAMDVLRWHLNSHIEADCFPVRDPRWFTFYEVEKDYETGDATHYVLLIPSHITPSSRLRVARLIGCANVE